MTDDPYLHSLHSAIAAETDPKRFEQLLNELDRYIDMTIKRARNVPNMQRR